MLPRTEQCAVAADLGRSVYRDTLYTHSLSLRLSHMHPIRFPSLTCSELDFMSETHHSVSESQVEYIAKAVVVTLML